MSIEVLMTAGLGLATNIATYLVAARTSKSGLDEVVNKRIQLLLDEYKVEKKERAAEIEKLNAKIEVLTQSNELLKTANQELLCRVEEMTNTLANFQCLNAPVCPSRATSRLPD